MWIYCRQIEKLRWRLEGGRITYVGDGARQGLLINIAWLGCVWLCLTIPAWCGCSETRIWSASPRLRHRIYSRTWTSSGYLSHVLRLIDSIWCLDQSRSRNNLIYNRKYLVFYHIKGLIYPPPLQSNKNTILKPKKGSQTLHPLFTPFLIIYVNPKEITRSQTRRHGNMRRVRLIVNQSLMW